MNRKTPDAAPHSALARLADMQEAVAPSAPGLIVHGRVFAREKDGRLGVNIGERQEWARRSLSCLVEPEAGDRVLLARAEEDLFVLAVLDRLVPDCATLSVPDARKIVLSAPDIALQAADRLALRGREATLDGENVRILAKSFALVGRLATFVAECLRSNARRSETVADEINVQAGERTTCVTGTDVSQIGTLVRHVDQISVETAHSAVITAKEDLRFDGTRVTVA